MTGVLWPIVIMASFMFGVGGLLVVEAFRGPNENVAISLTVGLAFVIGGAYGIALGLNLINPI